MTVRRTKSGFTLVEILIVVIILGILAAIVIPQFTSASQDARKNSLTSQLQTIRSQVELYKLQHLDNLPTTWTVGTAPDWSQFINKSDNSGATGTTTAFAFGPYLQSAPTNTLNGLNTIGQIAGDVNPTPTSSVTNTGGSVGFVINSADGKIWATSAKEVYIYNESNAGDPNNDL